LLVVLKAPTAPAVRVVTVCATGSEPASVMHVFVATVASTRRIFERRCPVTFLARYGGMQADQRKTGDVVIEHNLFPPPGLIVTLSTTDAKLALMGIVLLVTADTRCS
jgi:hypothetical protein